MSSSNTKMDLLTVNPVYKPFRYPWAYDAWLQQQRIHWIPEEVPLHDDVKDWMKIITPSEKNLLTQIFRFFTTADIEVNDNYMSRYSQVFKPTEIKMMLGAFSNMECFDRQTELLTSEGWKRVDQLTINDKVAQYDLPTQEISFVYPEKVVSYPYQGIMHSYENSATSICVTPNHELIVGDARTGMAGKLKSIDKRETRGYLYPSTGIRAKFRADIPIMHRLYIAIAADGSIRANCPSLVGSGHRTVDFDFHKEHKIGRLTNILSVLGVVHNWRPIKNDKLHTTFAVPGDDDITNLKSLDFIQLEYCTPEIAAGYLYEIIQWDGSHVSDSIKTFYSINKKAIDKVQALSVICGLSAISGVSREGGFEATFPNGTTSTNTQTLYSVRIVEQSWRSYPERTEIIYNDDVFCVSVPTQNIVSRRRGRVAITGNTVHIAAYSHLLDTVGMPEVEYSAFLEYKAMKDKSDYMHEFSVDSKHNIAKTLAVFGAFTEGLQLFSTFAILLNFPRFNKMKGMGQIITWSVRDESLHCDSIIKLFRVFVQENPEIWTEELKKDLYVACATIVDHEDAFIELVFELGDVEGLTAVEMKHYIRYIADRRLTQLGLNQLFQIEKNPLPWLDEMLNGVEHMNFFEGRSTEYSRASTEGTWQDAFADMDAANLLKPTVVQPTEPLVLT